MASAELVAARCLVNHEPLNTAAMRRGAQALLVDTISPLWPPPRAATGSTIVRSMPRLAADELISVLFEICADAY